MKIICDTHVLLFWADHSPKLSDAAEQTIGENIGSGNLFCADITLWEIAMLHARGHIRHDIEPAGLIRDIVLGMTMEVLPITPEIAVISQSDIFSYKDPADRIIAATAIHHEALLLSADEKLKRIEGLNASW